MDTNVSCKLILEVHSKIQDGEIDEHLPENWDCLSQDETGDKHQKLKWVYLEVLESWRNLWTSLGFHFWKVKADGTVERRKGKIIKSSSWSPLSEWGDEWRGKKQSGEDFRRQFKQITSKIELKSSLEHEKATISLSMGS